MCAQGEHTIRLYRRRRETGFVAYLPRPWKNSCILKSLEDSENSVQRETLSARRSRLLVRLMFAARGLLALTLLLTLITGNIAWSSAASGPLCTLACCAGRAPHVAGSCMNGACEAGLLKSDPESSHQSHHHITQRLEETDPQVPRSFAGAIVSAGGSDDDQVPTIEATSTAQTRPPGKNPSRELVVAAPALTKPCHADCGVCASNFTTPRRSRKATTLAGSNHSPPSSEIFLLKYQLILNDVRDVFSRATSPRGPPLSHSC